MIAAILFSGEFAARLIFTGLIKQFGNPLSFHVFTTVDTVHQVAFLTYVITSHNVMVYTVINVVSVYGPDTLHNRMSSAAVLISGRAWPESSGHGARFSVYATVYSSPHTNAE